MIMTSFFLAALLLKKYFGKCRYGKMFQRTLTFDQELPENYQYKIFTFMFLENKLKIINNNNKNNNCNQE